MNEDQIDARYDSDGAIGPFFDAVHNEPPLHGPDEEEIGVGVTSKLPDIPEPVTMKIGDVEKLKVIKLKDAIMLRGFSAKGNKPALISRLKDSIQNNLEVVCDICEGGVENFAGEGFSVGARWELEAANDDDVCIEEGISATLGTLSSSELIQRAPRFTDKSLHPITGSLSQRLEESKPHWPITTVNLAASCQLHRWALGGNKKKRAYLIDCSYCKVTLCSVCFVPFHTNPQLVDAKKKYGNSIQF